MHYKREVWQGIGHVETKYLQTFQEKQTILKTNSIVTWNHLPKYWFKWDSWNVFLFSVSICFKVFSTCLVRNVLQDIVFLVLISTFVFYLRFSFFYVFVYTHSFCFLYSFIWFLCLQFTYLLSFSLIIWK